MTTTTTTKRIFSSTCRKQPAGVVRNNFPSSQGYQYIAPTELGCWSMHRPRPHKDQRRQKRQSTGAGEELDVTGFAVEDNHDFLSSPGYHAAIGI